MEMIQSIILGVVQGITEFLPISSSGHLVIIPWLFNWKDMGLTFDVALHLGTLISIVIYFWQDWFEILKNWKKPLLWLILAACLPAAAVGFIFEDYFETTFRNPLFVGVFMILMGLLLFAAEILGKMRRDIKDIGLKDAFFIGFSQVLALMPGVSRSGITMTAGVFSGLNREAAAKFSFIMSVPIIAGAGLFKLRHIIVHGLPQAEAIPFYVGFISSAIAGYFVIKYLLAYLRRHTFYVFVWYRLIVGIAIIVVCLTR